MTLHRSIPKIKTMGIVVKQGNEVVSFEVDPNGPKLRFLQELEKCMEGKLTPVGDTLLFCVRNAINNQQYEFASSAERTEWKTLAFPILYGMRDLSRMHGVRAGRVVSRSQPLVDPGYSPTGRKLTEPEAQFIPLSWLRNKPNRPQGKK